MVVVLRSLHTQASHRGCSYMIGLILYSTTPTYLALSKRGDAHSDIIFEPINGAAWLPVSRHHQQHWEDQFIIEMTCTVESHILSFIFHTG